MKVHVVGGFLGAGKTTLARALARLLRARGERVLIVTNDQGERLVDTTVCGRAGEVAEIAGGCFCCRYELLEQTLVAAAEAGVTVTIAEAVGSCTDLCATVMAPLADRRPAFEVAPLAIAVDPWRVAEMDDPGVDPDVAYLFAKQIEEADVVLLTRADLAPPDVRARILSIRPDVEVIDVSGVTGAGVERWLAAEVARPAAPLDIDYERYAEAEAALGWANAEVTLRADDPFEPSAVAARFLQRLSGAPVAHVKLASVGPDELVAALVRRGAAPIFSSGDGAGTAEIPARAPTREARWRINARVALAPDALEQALSSALTEAARPATVTWDALSCFRPAAPVPTHRYASRPGASDPASCCAAFYRRSDIGYLLGDSLHPGGIALTLEVAERLDLGAGSRILDVACGRAASLRALVDRFSSHGVGLDVAAAPYRDDRLHILPGDAHSIPFDEASFDAVLCECALSTFADPAGALAEMRRVLRPGGRVAVTDMVLDGPLPPRLAGWIHHGACLFGARTLDGYTEALRAAGFAVACAWEAEGALAEILARIKRNLVGAALAAASGNLPADVKLDVKGARAAVREGEAAVAAGVVRYGVVVAERIAA